MRGLKEGDSPLDFIQKNLAAMQPPLPETAVTLQQVVANIEDKRAEEAKKETEASKVEYPTDAPKPPKEEPPKEEASPEGETQEDEPKNTTAENFRNIRKSLNETKSQLKEKENTLTQLQAELESYKKGEALPDVIKEKEDRIAELERYEKLVSLKTTKEYQEKYIQPILSIQNKLTEIAKDYEIPEEIMVQAMTINNRAELNRFLANHFDELGASEVKQLITQAKTLESEAKEAEKEPQTALEKLVAESKKIQEDKRRQQREALRTKSKDGWVESLLEIKNEGRALELIHREGDDEHNTKYVKPLLDKAAVDYGKLIVKLAENGLEELPPDLSKMMAKMCLLAHASSVSIDSRYAALQHAEELETNTKRTSQYYRPPIGASYGGGGVSPSKPPSSPKEAADVLLNSVLAKRGT